ncbi:MAG: LON peptidase substrate-binding domain-containing protein [Myxococcota bacterium]
MPLFPLPNAVLFPGTTLPLHLFEPRYRALAEYCVHGPRVMAIGTLIPGVNVEGDLTPPIYPILSVGTIAAERRLPDGRWDIALRGVCRLELVDEVPSSEPFRFIRARRVREQERPDDRIASERVRGAVVQVANLLPALWPQLSPQLVAATGPSTLADVVAAMFVEGHDDRRRLLEEANVGRRLEQLQTVLAGILLDLSVRSRAEGNGTAEPLN